MKSVFIEMECVFIERIKNLSKMWTNIFMTFFYWSAHILYNTLFTCFALLCFALHYKLVVSFTCSKKNIRHMHVTLCMRWMIQCAILIYGSTFSIAVRTSTDEQNIWLMHLVKIWMLRVKAIFLFVHHIYFITLYICTVLVDF